MGLVAIGGGSSWGWVSVGGGGQLGVGGGWGWVR